MLSPDLIITNIVKCKYSSVDNGQRLFDVLIQKVWISLCTVGLDIIKEVSRY